MSASRRRLRDPFLRATVAAVLGFCFGALAPIGLAHGLARWNVLWYPRPDEGCLSGVYRPVIICSRDLPAGTRLDHDVLQERLINRHLVSGPWFPMERSVESPDLELTRDCPRGHVLEEPMVRPVSAGEKDGP